VPPYFSRGFWAIYLAKFSPGTRAVGRGPWAVTGRSWPSSRGCPPMMLEPWAVAGEAIL